MALTAAERNKRYRARHPKTEAAYYRNHANKIKAASRAYYRNNRKAIRAQRIEKKYGLTPLQLAVLRAQQHGVCAVCRQAATRTDLYVDHNHATNKVRGMLCGPCNSALGLLKEDVLRIHALARYAEADGITGSLELV